MDFHMKSQITEIQVLVHVNYSHDDCQLIHKQGEIHLIVFAHI